MKPVYLLSLLLVTFLVPADDKRKLQKELSETFKAWIERDVRWIITDDERAAWKRLSTAEEQEQFIEQFWITRDPTPDTQENEYKEEHYRRIAYANEHFASGVEGWRTDRGRIYIMFGPPDEIESHPAGSRYRKPREQGDIETTTFAYEVWRYRYLAGIERQEVLLEFVDASGTGEFRLTIDPDEKDALLHVPRPGVDPTRKIDSSKQFELMQVLADVSRAPRLPARDLDEFVARTTVRYNLLPFRVRADYFRLTADTALAAITVAIANKDLTFQQRAGLDHAAVNVFGRVSTITRRVAHTFEEVVAVDLPPGALARSLDGSHVYWQALPLRPGVYRLSLSLKDVQSGNSGFSEVALRVPSFEEGVASASSLVLADRLERLAARETGRGPFAIGAWRVRPNVTQRFRDSLGFYVQLYNFESRAPIEYAILRGETIVLSGAEPFSGAVAKILPLTGLAPGVYTLRVRADGITREQSFTVAD
jgi:GWxTD domain-containing protein